MSKTKYTYAVARIRALEVSLLTNAVIEQLLACKSAEQALQLLVEKGWGDLTAGTLDADEVLNKEEEKVWQTIREVAPDMHVFDVLSLPKLYHNLKAAIKEVCTEVENKISSMMIVRFLEKKCMQLFRTKSLISCREICRQQQEKHLILCFTQETDSCVILLLIAQHWKLCWKQGKIR